MKTIAVNIKSFRSNIAGLARKAKKDSVRYIVTIRNKPVWEVQPCLNDTVELYDAQTEYYQTLENTLSFWKSKDDNDIFKV